MKYVKNLSDIFNANVSPECKLGWDKKYPFFYLDVAQDFVLLCSSKISNTMWWEFLFSKLFLFLFVYSVQLLNCDDMRKRLAFYCRFYPPKKNRKSFAITTTFVWMSLISAWNQKVIQQRKKKKLGGVVTAIGGRAESGTLSKRCGRVNFIGLLLTNFGTR